MVKKNNKPQLHHTPAATKPATGQDSSTLLFDNLLVANRGEIACRIMRTAKRLAVYTTAVYSDCDSTALHVRQADAAVHIGPSPATESYLCIEKIIAAAVQNGCDAIHPGYGFLSENAELARACERAGIVFVGPTASAMDAMGSKSAAKKLMLEAGVPVLPGYHGEEQDTDALQAQANNTGYPIMLKASAGGGGKGMRIVFNASEFAASLDSVKREASASFGDDRVLLERYVENPRHIEIQVFSDTQGNHLHLFERDCSVQRRHQKVLEEAPAPNLSESQRQIMGEAAVNAARAIDYRGAGTVEFIADSSGQFYFMEMNTRLQVEHPVTEMITGHDLVEWQLRVAAGQPLPASQDDLHINGHAIEARLYAEDPANEFLPASGKLELLQFPAGSHDLRVESGVTEGDNVSVFYDPMIAKIVAYGSDRDRALQLLQRALATTFIVGPTTNTQYLQYLLAQPDYIAGSFDTGFIETLPNPADYNNPGNANPWVAIAALWRHKQIAEQGWRLNMPATSRAFWRCNIDTLQLELQETSSGFLVVINSEGQTDELKITSLQIQGEEISASINNQHYRAIIKCIDSAGSTNPLKLASARPAAKIPGSKMGVFPQRSPNTPLPPVMFDLERLDPASFNADMNSGASGLIAPMPGKIISVKVKAGDKISEGDALMIVEAMKMEHTINAPRDGVIEEVYFSENDSVPGQAILLKLLD